MINPNIENQSESNIFIKSQLPINQLNHILNNNSYIINLIDKKGETLLSYAINNNNYKLCDLLLNNPKLNLYYKDNNGNSYLHLAVKNQNEKTIKKLIEKDINLNYKNNFGKTPLQIAYEYGNKTIIQILNNYGMNNLIRNNEHKLGTKVKTRKISNNNKKINILAKTLKSNKSEFKLLKNSIKSPKRKNANDNINNNNQKDKSMMISQYCKYYKSNPHFLIHNKTSNEKKRNNIPNKLLTSRRKFKNNIKCFKNSLTKDEEREEISKTDNNLLNYTSKDTKFITDAKEKSNNVEDISSFIISQSSDSKNNYNGKEKNNTNTDNNNLRRKYIIYDTSYMKDEREKQNSFENKNKSSINLNKFNTIIQNKYAQLNTDSNYKENIKYKILNNQSNKKNLKKTNQITTNKIINKTIGIVKLKNQNSFNNKINIKNNNNSNIKEKKNNKIYYILKKRNLKRGEIFNLSQNKKENNNKLYLDCNKERNQIDENGLTMNSSKLLKDFLSQINMGKYISILAFNGFDDINLILEQSKNGSSSIQDSELKEAGIIIPGDRAKILIRIQELSNNFEFPIPKEVYYSIKNYKNILDDQNIIKLRKWLENLKIEKYLNNFIDNGYNSIELLFIQMISSNPLTNEILKEEIKIDKVGYRSRIINKLKEDSKNFINDLKLNMLIVSKDEGEYISKYNNCQCIIL